MAIFSYHNEILNDYPALRTSIIHVQGVRNGTSSKDLQKEYRDEQASVLVRIENKPLSDLESLSAWRKAFRQFGVNPTRYRSAPEALLRRLTKKGDIPLINALVDICNLVSIRYGIPVASMDLRQVQGAITVKYALGNERFTPLGASDVENPEPGEVIFADDSDMVVARRWCWRQSDESASREQTTEIVITIEALHDTAQSDVESAAADIQALLGKFVGGAQRLGFLGPDNPALVS